MSEERNCERGNLDEQLYRLGQQLAEQQIETQRWKDYAINSDDRYSARYLKQEALEDESEAQQERHQIELEREKQEITRLRKALKYVELQPQVDPMTVRIIKDALYYKPGGGG